MREQVDLLLLQLRAARMSIDPREMRKICRRGLDLIAEDARFAAEAGQLEGGIGVSWTFARDHECALSHFERARNMAAAAGATQLVLQLTLRIARSQMSLLEPEKAWHELKQAETLLEKLEPEGHRREHHRAVWCGHCAELARWSEQYADALAWADGCLHLNLHARGHNRPDPIGCAIACLTKARIVLSQGDADEAAAHAGQALLELRKPPSNVWWTYGTFLTFAEAHAKCGRIEEASIALQSAESLWLHRSSSDTSLDSWHNLESTYIAGLIARHQGHLDSAQRLLRQAANGWRSSPDFLRCAPDLAAALWLGPHVDALKEQQKTTEERDCILSLFREAYQYACRPG